MPKPTTATFWSSGSPESQVKMLLVSTDSSYDAMHADRANRLVDRISGLSVSAVYAGAPGPETGLAVLIVRVLRVPLHAAAELGNGSSEAIVESVTEVARNHPGESVVLVLEREIAALLIKHWLGISLESAHEIGVEDCSLNLVVFHGNRVVLETVNDVCHNRLDI